MISNASRFLFLPLGVAKPTAHPAGLVEDKLSRVWVGTGRILVSNEYGAYWRQRGHLCPWRGGQGLSLGQGLCICVPLARTGVSEMLHLHTQGL